MSGLEKTQKDEQSRNAFRVETEIEGHPVTFDIVNSVHFTRTTVAEIQGADALLLEGSGVPKDVAEFVEYEDIIKYAQKSEIEMAMIDADREISDVLKIAFEELLRGPALTVVGGLLAIHTAAHKLDRRSFIKGAASLPFLMPPAQAFLSAAADHRPGSISGTLAQNLAALNDKNPLSPQLTIILRNRVMAHKAYLVAKFLISNASNSGQMKPSISSFHIPIVVGSAHTDIGRLLLREPEKNRSEIEQMCTVHGMTPEFLASVGTVHISKYDSKTQKWLVTTVMDKELVEKAIKQSNKLASLQK